MLEPVLNPIFNYFCSSWSSEEISASVRKIEQVVLPLVAAAGTFRASSSAYPALAIRLTYISGITVALAVFVRNWRASNSAQLKEESPPPDNVDVGALNSKEEESEKSEDEEGRQSPKVEANVDVGASGSKEEKSKRPEGEEAGQPPRIEGNVDGGALGSKEEESKRPEGEEAGQPPRGEGNVDGGALNSKGSRKTSPLALEEDKPNIEDSERRDVEEEKEAEDLRASRSSEFKVENLSEVDRKISALLKSNATLEDLQFELDDLETVSTEEMSLEERREAHEASKTRFQDLLKSCPEFRAAAHYCSPGNLANMEFPRKEDLCTTANRFLVYTTDTPIEQRILRFSQDRQNAIHILALSSQYDAREFKWIESQPFGYENRQVDPHSRNEKLFALTDFYLTNGGFNMLAGVLTEETMKCMKKGKLLLAKEKYTREPSGLSYIPPEDIRTLDNKKFWQKELAAIEQRTKQFTKEKWSHLELPCLEMVPDGGINPVHFILTAAPHLGAIAPYELLLRIKKLRNEFDNAEEKKTVLRPGLKTQLEDTPQIFKDEQTRFTVDSYWKRSEFLREEFPRFAAFASYMAQFGHALSVARDNPKKEVILHLSAVGIGSYRNLPNVVASALLYAAHFFDEKLRNEGITNISVFFERTNDDNEAARICIQTLADARGVNGQVLFTRYNPQH